MNQKKLVYIFLVIAITLTLFLPVLNVYFASKNIKNNVHNFTKQQLFSTDNFESLMNYFVYKTFNFSLNERQVIVGKDGFFFLGNGFGAIIDKTTGTFPYNARDIDIWTGKLKTLQDWYEKQGIQFIVVVASNKHTIYSDKLPDKIVYKEGENFTDVIVKQALDKNIHILNLKEVLREKKEDKQLYFYTDTHWNNYGAQLGYINTMQFLNNTYGQEYKIPRYTMKEEKVSGGGDLSNLLKINKLLSTSHEKDYNFIFNEKRTISYGKITKKNGLSKCTPNVKKKFNHYTINKKALNKEKLLYLCDSFGLVNSPLYEETFHTLWRFHISYTHGKMLTEFIKKNKPDIVIYQVIERDLGNNSIVDDFPNIVN